MNPMNTELSAQPLPVNAITHGWIRPVAHPDLGVTINGQSVVRYLRFGREVRLDRLELKPGWVARGEPGVPSHPAHVTVATLDAATGRWRTLRDVELPPDPRIAGEGLHQRMTPEEMSARLRECVNTVHTIPLDGLTTDLLRVECDREHPVWPSHGECNGAPFSVPFATLNTLAAFGQTPAGEMPMPAYLPPLTVGAVQPQAPAGMAVEALPWMVLFRGPRFSIGFSLRRPEIVHLGFDGVGGSRAGENRVCGKSPLTADVGGISGPVLRTARGDFGPQTWTGRVEVAGNRVCYRELHCGKGVTIDATFTVNADGFELKLEQRAECELFVLEAEAWRLAWDTGCGMVAAAAVPTLRPGRNGEVDVPFFWATDGNGCLRCERVEGDARLQMESYRTANAIVGGVVPGARPAPDAVLRVPAGTSRSAWRFTVTAFEPAGNTAIELSPALRRHWGSIYSCFRPEYGGFSNNALSVNCHVNQHGPNELTAFTRVPARGPDPLELYRFTLERAVLGGGGYGFWRNLYLDSDPILMAGVGRCHQVRPDLRWLRRLEPGLAQTAERLLGTLGAEGLAVCRDLSGDSGSYRWSCNAMDVVGFGHMDAYVNAWTYRGLRNAAPLLRELGRATLGARCAEAAEALRNAFPRYLLNPETGWVAGWRSRDGQLHDAAYVWVNGVACAFGLLATDQAATALRGLECLRHEVGAGDAHFGLPHNLRPIPPEDHMLPRLRGRFMPTFETYTDGAMSTCTALYYLRALEIHGLNEAAGRIVADLETGYARDHFRSGGGSWGNEFYRWDGVPCGYEGSFVLSYGALYAIAIHRGVLAPATPEWWPG